ncbi:MAG TPA: TonB-dependent receptor [Sphingomicrobium sp.]|nr:TonB-dependent receptor [Sphingomicrobium sp.]
MKKFVLLCTTAMLPSAVYAQSAGSVEFENKTIIITGTKQRAVGGVVTPQTPKAKIVLNQDIISRQNPGQTILDTINLVPGVSFQNNDPYGSAGGTLTIRGFSSDRISLTFDGIQLNDSGNYAIYSNQQLDPELIEQVNVNLGSTDVDSPTGSAVGGTVNYRTITPTEKMGVRLVGTVGDYNYRRIFGLVNTGAIGPWGTRAFLAGSIAKYDNPFNNYGKMDKKQVNARIWQPVGSNGDFISIAGHYNENRNNFFGSLPLRLDPTRTVGSGSGNRFPRNAEERQYNINYPCTTTPAVEGHVDVANTCGTEFDRRYNPSNTGNIRISSKFTLADGVTLNVEPSYQYVKANGGGTVVGREGTRIIDGVAYTGFIGGQYYFGRDLNGDNDVLDTCNTTGASCSSSNFSGVELLAPSQTHTDRFGLITNLRWDINPNQSVRVGYTWDHARHRQTGEVGFLKANGEPVDVFPINDGIRDANGELVEKRNRLSYAILNQVFGEYRGVFGPVTVNVGLRAPFFTRKLNNFCFATAPNGNVDCLATDALNQSYAASNPTLQGPQKRNFKYHKLLPNIGAIYNITPSVSAFANYSKGLSVPSTDNLYNSFFFAPGTAGASPKPETTDNFDGGFRYRTSKIQAQLSGWYTKFKNRQASAYDPELDRTVFRNLGDVNKWGIDGSLAYSPFKALTVYAFGSWQKSKIADNIQIGALPAGIASCDDPAAPITACAFTAGKYESGVPKYMYGVSADTRFGPFEFGVEAKRTGPRFVYDVNAPTYTGPIADPTAIIYPAKTPAYWLVNLDVRYKLERLNPALKNTYFQLNVFNLFDQYYVGGFNGGLNQAFSGANYGNPGFVQIGAPRAVMGSVNVQF